MKVVALFFLLSVWVYSVYSQPCNTNFVVQSGATPYFVVNTTSNLTTVENSQFCQQAVLVRPACTASNLGCQIYYYNNVTNTNDLQVCTTTRMGTTNLPSYLGGYQNTTYQWESLSGQIELRGDAYVSASADDTSVISAAPIALTDVQIPPRPNSFQTLDSSKFYDIDTPSIAIGVDGNPIVAYRYQDATNNHIRVVFCSDPYCADPVKPTIIPNAAGYEMGTFVVITIDKTGNPIMLCSGTPNGYTSSTTVVFIRCLDRFCTSVTHAFPEIEAGINQPNVGRFTGIAIGSNGFPVLLYDQELPSSNTGFYVHQCTNLACTQAMAPSYYQYPLIYALSFAISPQTGFPVVMVISNNQVYVLYCTNIACSTYSTINNQVTIGGTTGAFPVTNIGSMSITDNGLVYLYTAFNFQIAPHTIQSTFCDFYSLTCTSPGVQTVSQNNTITGIIDVRTAVDAKGYPVMITLANYTVPSTNGPGSNTTILKYSMCSDGQTCARYTVNSIILDMSASEYGVFQAQPGSVGFRLSTMAIGVNGYPVIAYANYGQDQTSLRFMALSSRYGTPYYKRRNQ